MKSDVKKVADRRMKALKASFVETLTSPSLLISGSLGKPISYRISTIEEHWRDVGKFIGSSARTYQKTRGGV